MREGLDPESLILFDLLKKPSLTKPDIDKLKKVANNFCDLQARKKEIDDWRAKEATQDLMRQTIYDFLFSDETGLPESYTIDDISEKTQTIYEYIFTSAPVGEHRAN